jgi:hypothetical protein
MNRATSPANRISSTAAWRFDALILRELTAAAALHAASRKLFGFPNLPLQSLAL